MRGKAKVRGRRPEGEVRAAILEAARKRLANESIRLTEVARDVGISHPAIFHHFGSRNGLTQSLAQDAQDRLSADVLSTLSAGVDESTIGPIVRRVLDTLGDSGHTRLPAWRGLEMEHPLPEDSEREMIRDLTNAVHLRRVEYARVHEEPVPAREDSAFLVRLLGATLVGEAIVGPVFELRAELDGQGDSRNRFRSWLSDLVTSYVEGADVAVKTRERDRP